MASNREGVNPLRPYYIPPTIGEPPDPGPSAGGSSSFSSGNAAGKYASKAPDIFPALDYKDYISDSSPSALHSVKALADELLWQYTSVLMAQPFEVAKTLLQLRIQDDLGGLAAIEAGPAKATRQLSYGGGGLAFDHQVRGDTTVPTSLSLLFTD